ncbi:MAG: rhodanese-like domain-containing protein [Armatimonadetes bacterium]|nr:rhodanese-like domain-containing protein [Armatimonadota bacterium]
MFLKPLAVLSLAAPLALTIALPARSAEVPSISHTDLVKAIKTKKVVVLDVNGSESYKAGRIPGALNYEAVGSNLKAKLPANKKALIVAYCGNEYCGAYKRAAVAAMKLGYTNVKHYSPGIAGWKKSGAKIDKS